MSNSKIPTIIRDNTVWIDSKKLLKIPPSHKTILRRITPGVITAKSETISLHEAHMRLNHISNQTIQDSIKNGIFADINVIVEKNSPDWLICEVGKNHRHPHYKGSMSPVNIGV